MGKNIGTRVNLTLPPEVVSVLDRMADITGAGRSTLIREWLQDALPIFNNLAAAMESAQQNNLDALSSVSRLLQEQANSAASGVNQLQLDIAKRRKPMRKKKR